MFTSVLKKLIPSSIHPHHHKSAIHAHTVMPIRHAGEIAHPRKLRHKKAHKGRVPIPINGSISGTSLIHGQYGLALKQGARLSADQLESARRIIRRKIRPYKGTEMWLRVFPDIPVTSKGNETRMGKGKGSFDYFCCRVPMYRIVFEIGAKDPLAPPIPWIVVKDALRQAGQRFPVPTTIVTPSTPPLF